ncbi:hypothetical protein FACS1894159_00870 [Bacteroidia bacterium]|nr:hypothetical protein FACS1894159_00870 [Bacteroidia bacterium]
MKRHFFAKTSLFLCLAALSLLATTLASCVKKDAGESLTLSCGSSLSFGPLAGADTTIFVSVVSPFDWTIQSKPDWMSVSPEASDGSPMLLTITASRNEDIDARTGELVFVMTSGAEFTIPCYQLSTHGSLLLRDVPSYSLTYELQTRQVSLFSNLKNLSCTIVADDPSWLGAVITPSGQQFDFTCDITVEENKTGENRSAKVALVGDSYDGQLSDTIYITQKYFMESLAAHVTNDDTAFSFEWAQSTMPQVVYYLLEVTDNGVTPTVLATYDVSLQTSCLIDTMTFISTGSYVGNIILNISGKTAPDAEVILAQTRDEDGAANSHFAGGTGSGTDPYRISCARHFDNIMALSGTTDPRGMMSGFYKQTADITFPAPASPAGPSGAIVSNLSPIGTKDRPFMGVYDGDGHKLNNVCIVSEDAYVGVFTQLGHSTTTTAAINNLNVLVSYIEGRTPTLGSSNNAAAIGGIVGMNGGTIDNCTVDKYGPDAAIYGNNRPVDPASTDVSAYFGYTGGIAGVNERMISNCANKGCPVVAKFTGGGIAGGTANATVVWGTNNGTCAIKNCYNLAPVYQGNPGPSGTLPMGIDITAEIGGLSNLFTASGITGDAIGNNNGLKPNITYCFNGGDVYSESIAAGITGNMRFGLTEKCYNYGTITVVRNNAVTTGTRYAGGIAGHLNNNNNKTNTCYNVGLITYSDQAASPTNIFLGGCVGNKPQNTANNQITDLVYVVQSLPTLNGVCGSNGGANGIVGCITLSDADMKVLSNYPSTFTATDWEVLPTSYAYPHQKATPMP